MYPVKIGYAGALQRIKDLVNNGHHAESLVTAMFTVEKTLRRTLRQLVVSAGFPSSIADTIVGQLRGLDAIKSAWQIYDPRHRKLTDLIAGGDWQAFTTAAGMRNKLVHGVRVYSLADCQQQTVATLAALDNMKTLFDNEYGYSGWTILKVRRSSRLHLDPKVTWTP
jgi:hypothetical protein